MSRLVKICLLLCLPILILAGCRRPSHPPQHSQSGWPFRTNGEIFTLPCIDTDSIYFGSMNGEFYCVDKDSGTVNWKMEKAKCYYSAPMLSGDLVYFASINGKVWALSRRDGVPQWSSTLPCFASHMELRDQRIIYSGKNELGVLSATTGETLHRYKFKGNGGPLAADARSVIVVNNTDTASDNYTGSSEVLCFEYGKSAPLWKTSLEGCSLQKIASDGERCFLGARDGFFYSLRTVDGSIAWRIDCRQFFTSADSTSSVGANPVWVDNHVLDLGTSLAFNVGHQNIQTPAALVIAEKSTGNILHFYLHPQSISGSFVEYGKHLIAATEDRKLVVMSIETGQTRVFSVLPVYRRGEFAGVICDGDVLYVAGADGCVHKGDGAALLKQYDMSNKTQNDITEDSARP